MKLLGNNCVKNIKNSIGILILLLVTGCQYFHKNADKTPMAKIYQNYLYFEDIDPSIYRGKSAEDSLNALHQYIENWAYKTLILKEAEQNVDTLKINRLVKQYRQDLLTETYKQRLLQKYIDTLVPQDTLKQYYQKYRHYFTAQEPLLKLKYLIVNKQEPKIHLLKKWFFSNKQVYSDSLIKNTNLLSKFDIETNHWYKIPELKEKLPVFKHLPEKYILKKSKKFVLTDSLSLYLVFIKDLVLKNQDLPLSVIKDDLKQLILSNRKQAALSRLENNIKKEAINKKIFKIFKKDASQ